MIEIIICAFIHVIIRSLVVSRSAGVGGVAGSAQGADTDGDVGKVYSGHRMAPLRGNFDVRAFFLAGDRVRSARRIDSRCAKMIEKGLLREVTQLIIDGRMNSEFMCAKAIGYRQSLEYLLYAAAAAAAATAATATAVPPSVDGDEQGGEGGYATCLQLDEKEHNRRAFWEYFERFSAATRSYAASQVKWFRSSKGNNFMWLMRDTDSDKDKQHEQSIQLPTQTQLDALADEIVRWSCLPSGTFLEELRSEHQVMARKKDRFAAKEMRYYASLKPWSQGKEGEDLLQKILIEVSECSAKIRKVAAADCIVATR